MTDFIMHICETLEILISTYCTYGNIIVRKQNPQNNIEIHISCDGHFCIEMLHRRYSNLTWSRYHYTLNKY